MSAWSHLRQGIKTEEKTKSGKLGIKKVKYTSNGDWRNWLARMHGVHEVAGSNPVFPTDFA